MLKELYNGWEVTFIYIYTYIYTHTVFASTAEIEEVVLWAELF